MAKEHTNGRNVRARQRGFTMIEMLIVVSVIVIIATIAVPNYLSSKVVANEAAVVATLRKVSTAEELFRNGRYVDQDGNSWGEFGYLGELSGITALRSNVEAMRRETNLSRLMWLDFEFHREIASAAHNVVPRLIMNSVRGLLRKYTHLLEGLWVSPGSISAGYEHIVAAVESQDGHRARSLMEWIWLGREQRFSAALASIRPTAVEPKDEGAKRNA